MIAVFYFHDAVGWFVLSRGFGQQDDVLLPLSGQKLHEPIHPRLGELTARGRNNRDSEYGYMMYVLKGLVNSD